MGLGEARMTTGSIYNASSKIEPKQTTKEIKTLPTEEKHEPTTPQEDLISISEQHIIPVENKVSPWAIGNYGEPTDKKIIAPRPTTNQEVAVPKTIVSVDENNPFMMGFGLTPDKVKEKIEDGKVNLKLMQELGLPKEYYKTAKLVDPYAPSKMTFPEPNDMTFTDTTGMTGLGGIGGMMWNISK